MTSGVLVPTSQASQIGTATAIVAATTPAALLPWQGGTVLGRLLGQLESRGIGDIRVLTCPALEADVREAAGRHSVVVAGDLRELAGAGDVLMVSGDIVTSDGALAATIEDPRDGTIALVGDDAAFLGVIRIRAADMPAVAVATDDITDSLVRAGVPIGTLRLPGVFWHRAGSVEELEAAERELRGYDDDKVLLDAAVKASDGFFTTFFVSPYSRYIARWAARRGFTPNQVTIASAVIGLLAAAAFATGERWGLVAGALLLQAAFTADCVDGQLARYTRTFTKFGAWLDATLDRTKEYVVYAGLAIGASAAGDPVWTLACAALALQTIRHMADLTFAERVRPPSERTPRGWAATNRVPGAIWVKKMAAFPIGERFAAISITAAFFDARVTFVVLLAWGLLAAVYTVCGRLLRSAPPGAPGKVASYRDDGPLALAIGRALGTVVRVPAPALLLAGPGALLAIAGLAGRDASTGLAAAAIAWLVLTVGITTGRRPDPSFEWSVPSLVRLGEYATLTWLAAIDGAEPAAFALLAVLAFRHYDLVYRLRHRGDTPPRWLNLLAAGWEGRVIIAWVFLALGVVEGAMFAWAALLGAASLAETVIAWMRVDSTGGEFEVLEGEAA